MLLVFDSHKECGSRSRPHNASARCAIDEGLVSRYLRAYAGRASGNDAVDLDTVSQLL